jgi:hypothetical protein
VNSILDSGCDFSEQRSMITEMNSDAIPAVTVSCCIRSICSDCSTVGNGPIILFRVVMIVPSPHPTRNLADLAAGSPWPVGSEALGVVAE